MREQGKKGSKATSCSSSVNSLLGVAPFLRGAKMAKMAYSAFGLEVLVLPESTVKK